MMKIFYIGKDKFNKRAKKSSFKMVKLLHSNAVHLGKSTQEDTNTKLVRKLILNMVSSFLI